MDLPKRLAAKIYKLPGESNCWEWVGARADDGYGQASWKGRRRAAHRVVYELVVGPIPAGTVVHHKCNNKNCVRPDHLEAMTQRDNTLSSAGPAGQNARKTHCPRGHPYDGVNTRISVDGQRYCRTCRREYARWWRAKHYVAHPRRKGVPEGQGRLF